MHIYTERFKSCYSLSLDYLSSACVLEARLAASGISEE